jgi:hypothetical protein
MRIISGKFADIFRIQAAYGMPMMAYHQRYAGSVRGHLEFRT